AKLGEAPNPVKRPQRTPPINTGDFESSSRKLRASLAEPSTREGPAQLLALRYRVSAWRKNHRLMTSNSTATSAVKATNPASMDLTIVCAGTLIPSITGIRKVNSQPSGPAKRPVKISRG